ncbi:MAG: glucose dehydrogenase [Gemmatimonadetes bacterium]|nr:glucose dehydrogenase [Gemmatimonadota bacterium]
MPEDMLRCGVGPRAIVAAVGLTVVLGACRDATSPTSEGTLALEVVTDEVASPVGLASPPGDASRIFVLEQPGRVRVIRDGTLLTDAFLDITSETSADGERGLLGLAFHPDYDVNGYVFVYYTDNAGDTRVERFTAAGPDMADPGSGQIVLAVDQPYSNHNGGHMAFGPDGYLYVALGDGGDGGDPQGNGQDLATLLGSILRLDVDGGSPYAVPSDNPFVGTAGASPEIWVYGLRNPWRFSFDRANGDLYIGDVGQSRLEEISVQDAGSGGGENFGWNVMEGTDCFGAASCNTSGLTLPVYEYDHDEGCSVTGGYVYRGAALTELAGRYFFGDFCSGFVRSFRYQAGAAVDVQDHGVDLGTIGGLSSFGEDSAGELYLLDIEGVVYRLVASD